MARPTKAGMDYFPHDTDASTDDKIETLRSLFGNDGYAFYFILLEKIYRSPDASLDISSPSTLKLLLNRLRIRQQKFNKILQESLSCSLFDKQVYENTQHLTSSAIQRRHNAMIKQRTYAKRYYEQNKDVSSVETTSETSIETTSISDVSQTQRGKEREIVNINIKEKGKENVPEIYTKYFGEVRNDQTRDLLKEIMTDYPEGWFTEAVYLTSKNKVKDIRYTLRILERWKTEGKNNGHQPVATVGDVPKVRPGW